MQESKNTESPTAKKKSKKQVQEAGRKCGKVKGKARFIKVHKGE